MNIVEPFVKQVLDDTPYKKIEYAGRICYKTQDKIADESYIKFVENIIKRGHCYDGDTEVLTEKGFIPFKNYNGEKVAAINTGDATFKGYEVPINIIDYTYSGSFYNYETLGIIVTDGHNMYGKLIDKFSDRNSDDYSLFACNSKPISKKIKKNSNGEREFRVPASCSLSPEIETSDFGKLIGFFAGDGSIIKNNADKLVFHMIKDRKIKYLKKVCDSLGYESFYKKETKRFYVIKENIGTEFYEAFTKEGIKVLPYINGDKESLSLAAGIFDGLINSDGSIGKSDISFSNTSDAIIDWMINTGPIIGYNITEGTVKEEFENHRKARKLFILKSNKILINDNRKKDLLVKVFTGTQRVFCVETSTGLIVVRGKNKKVFLCGNCSVLEHESVTIEIPYYFSNDIPSFYEFGFFEVSSSDINHNFYITGNIRAWKDYFNQYEMFFPFISELYDTIGTDYEIIFPIKSGFRNIPDYLRVVNFNNMSRVEIEEDYFPFEEAKKHLTTTFHIRTDRATSHQIVRHRLSSFSQESQRFVNYSLDKFDNTIKFILPVEAKELEDEMDGVEEIKKSFLMCEKAYFSLIEKGVKPETARCVLPNATATEIIMTSNYKQWDRFFNLRCDSHAQIDIRNLANVIRDIIYRGK